MNSLCALLVLVASATAASVGNRIIGGTPANIQQYPFQVSLQQNAHHICGGALVKPNKVITAATCTERFAKPKNILSVMAGSTNRMQGGTYILARSVAHPEYRPDTFDCDVAVLTLMMPFQLSATISPIGLVGIGKKALNGASMTVAGWGMTQTNSHDTTATLTAIQLPVVGNVACQAAYRNAGKVILDRAFCIGDGTRGPSGGDSGNAVVNSNKQLAGVVSWGPRSAMAGYPTVATDLSHALIRRFVDDNSS